VTPVQQVINLLTNMVEKGKAATKAEQVQFATYKQFCDDTLASKQSAIAENTELIEILTAEVEKGEADAADAAREIASLEADIATWEGDEKAAIKVREIENTNYVATHKDYSESVTACEAAVAILMKTSMDVKQASAALMEVSRGNLVPKDAKHLLDAFLAVKTQDVMGAPEANAYEFQSKAIVDMLSKLAAKFWDERSALEEEEANAVHSFNMLKADLESQLAFAAEAKSKQAATKARSLQAAADAKGSLEDAVTTRDDDEKYAADLTATCEQKSSDFANRQTLRAGELDAINKAIEILSGKTVEMSEKHLPQLLQRKTTSLAQLRSDSQNPNQKKVAAYLTRRAHELHSRVLSAFALRVSADPFKKVKKMVKDLIVKLMEEANAEVEHKGYCDMELATNEHTRKEKSEAVVMLTAEIDELTASITSLAGDMAELSAAISELDKAVSEATKVRLAEQAKNTATIADAQEGQKATETAHAVLVEFYDKAAEATSFAQKSSAKVGQPAIFEGAYTGMQAENGGVLGMLETIESDFERLEAETSASEAEAAKQYEEFMNDSKVDKTQKQADLDHAASKKQNQEQSLQATKTDLTGTQKELTAAVSYYEKLKPACVTAGDSYDDRVAKRKEEIESLQEALRILNGEDVI